MQSFHPKIKLRPIIYSALILLAATGCGKKDGSDAIGDALGPSGGAPTGPFLTLQGIEHQGGYNAIKVDRIEGKIETIAYSARRELTKWQRRGMIANSNDGQGSEGERWFKECFEDQQGEVDIRVNGDAISVSLQTKIGECFAEGFRKAWNADVKQAQMDSRSYQYQRCKGKDLSYLKHLEGRRAGRLGDILNWEADLNIKDCADLEIQYNEERSLYIDATLHSDVGTWDMKQRTKSSEIIATEDNKPCRFTYADNKLHVGSCMVVDRTSEINEPNESENREPEHTESIQMWKTSGLDIRKDDEGYAHTTGLLDMQINDWTGTIEFKDDAGKFDFDVSNGSENKSGSLVDDEPLFE